MRFGRSRNTPNIPFKVTIIDDDVPEPVEVLTVQVRCADNENCYSLTSFYTITVVDDQGDLLQD